MIDLISREASINAAINADMENNDGILSEKNARVIEEHFSIVPTIEERKKGRWNIKLIRPVYGGVTFRVDARCSECGVFIAQTTTQRKMTYRFCPYCGADMRGEDNGKENAD